MVLWNGNGVCFTIQDKGGWFGRVVLVIFSHVFLLSSMQCVNVKPQKEVYAPNYRFYHNLTQIDTEVKLLSNFPDYVKVYKHFLSRQGRPMYLLHISNFSDSLEHKSLKDSRSPRDKPKILFSYGEHAREFLPVESAIYFIKNLTGGLHSNADLYSREYTQKILLHSDLYIILMANPDGRHFVEQTRNYCWRGTSTGVDLDRNFGWEFGGKGSSSDPEDEEYRGKKAFSEPESKVFEEISTDIAFNAFFSFHSGINHIYIPYSDTKSQQLQREPDNVQEMLSLALRLSRCCRYNYRYGTSHHLINYTADGTIFDYMAGIKKIPFSFAIELWGKQHNRPSCFDLFNPENRKLKEVVKSLHPLYIHIIMFLSEWKSRNHQDMANPNAEHPSLVLGYMLVGITMAVSLMMCLHRKWRNCPQFYHRQRIVSLKTLSSSFSAKNL